MRALFVSILFLLPFSDIHAQKTKPRLQTPSATPMPTATVSTPQPADPGLTIHGPLAQVALENRLYVIRILPTLSCLVITPPYTHLIVANPALFAADPVPLDNNQPPRPSDTRFVVRPQKLESSVFSTTLTVLLQDGKRIHILLERAESKSDSVFECQFQDPEIEQRQLLKALTERQQLEREEFQRKQEESFAIKVRSLADRRRVDEKLGNFVRIGDAELRLVAENVEGRTVATVVISNTKKKPLEIKNVQWSVQGKAVTPRKIYEIGNALGSTPQLESVVFPETAGVVEFSLSVGKKPGKVTSPVFVFENLPALVARYVPSPELPNTPIFEPQQITASLTAPSPNFGKPGKGRNRISNARNEGKRSLDQTVLRKSQNDTIIGNGISVQVLRIKRDSRTNQTSVELKVACLEGTASNFTLAVQDIRLSDLGSAVRTLPAISLTPAAEITKGNWVRLYGILPGTSSRQMILSCLINKAIYQMIIRTS